MKTQTNTDNHIAGRQALSQQAEASAASALGHPSIARVFDAGATHAGRARLSFRG